MANSKNYFTGLTKNTFLLTFASFFADVSTEMIYPVLPIFLTQVLSAPATIIGLVEGIAQGTQNIIQGFSGWLSDKTQKKKPIALFGYFLAAASKPFIGLSVVWPQVLAGRFADRLGAGTRTAPRDALIAASAGEAHRGKAFGLEGVGDNMGAVLGPIIAAFLIFSLHTDLRLIFYLAFIPGILAFVMILFVSEKKIIKKTSEKIKIRLSDFPKHYWRYLAVMGLFGLGNSSNAFLILRTKDIGIGTEMAILIYAGFNLAAAMASFPAGALSDKLGRRNILVLSLLIFSIVYFGFAGSRNILLIAFLFVFYGVSQGIFRAVGKAMATDFSPLSLRATGVGLYSTVIGLTTLFASIIGGLLWDKVDPSATFLYGAVFAALGCLTLFIFIPQKLTQSL